MKKIFLFAVAACFIGSAAKAQDVYKQTGGEKNVEVLFAPFGGSPIGINGIKFRSFTSATTAIRAEVFLGFGSSSDVIGALENGDEVTSSSSSFDIEINPGIEFHLPGTDRLSPYYGGFVQIGFNRTGSTTEIPNGDNTSIAGESTTTDGALRLGAFGVGGFDYYFAHNIYLGAEIGFGLGFVTNFDTVTENNAGNETVTTEIPNGSSFDLGPTAVGRLRLGILF